MSEEVKEKKRRRDKGAGDKRLLKLNKEFERSKADQIFRLLCDQEDLNKRFHECALLEEDEEPKDCDDGISDDNTDDKENDGSVSDISMIETERRQRTPQQKSKKPPSRCKTSLGFHKDIEVPGVPYSTERLELRDSDSSEIVQKSCVKNVNTSITRSGNVRRRKYKVSSSVPYPLQSDSSEVIPNDTRKCRPKTSYGERRRRYPVANNRDSDSDSDNPVFQNEGVREQTIERQNLARSAPSKPRGTQYGFCEGPGTSQTIQQIYKRQQPIHQPQPDVHMHVKNSRQDLATPPSSRLSRAQSRMSETPIQRPTSKLQNADSQSRPTPHTPRQSISVDITPITASSASRRSVTTPSSDPYGGPKRGKPQTNIHGAQDRYNGPAKRTKAIRPFEGRNPSMTVMKLPPLESPVTKPVPTPKRMLSVGKDTYV